MPLLGRHKSLPGGNQAASSQKQQQSSPALVCESPLFGTRCQLPTSTGSQQQSSGSSSKQSLAKHQSWSTGAKNSRPGSPQAPDASAAETLGSIPKQITRQQIHYAFNIMDTNADGLIDLRDLSQMLANLGVPIDEAILSHVMSSVSKRGDHRISEAEFLDWIGNFIQVSDLDTTNSMAASSSRPNQRSGSGGVQRRAAASRSSSSPSGAANSSTRSSSSALVAQSDEAQQLIQQQMRQRRGSGSGLALMRSLSSSSSSNSAGATSSGRDSDDRKRLELDTEPEAGEKRSTLAAEQQKEACDDLKAAFCVFDLDGDGFITIDEVQQGLKLLGESWSLNELNQLLFSKCESASQTAAAAGKKAAKTSASSSQKQRISIDDFVKLLL